MFFIKKLSENVVKGQKKTAKNGHNGFRVERGLKRKIDTLFVNLKGHISYFNNWDNRSVIILI